MKLSNKARLYYLNKAANHLKKREGGRQFDTMSSIEAVGAKVSAHTTELNLLMKFINDR